MNTADRSIALVDAAMRRRFAFVSLHPSARTHSAGCLRRWLKAEGRPTEPGRPARRAQRPDRGRRLQDRPVVLHARPACHRGRRLERIWRTSILPLLEEHHYGEGVDVRKSLRAGATLKQSAAAESPLTTMRRAWAPMEHLTLTEGAPSRPIPLPLARRLRRLAQSEVALVQPTLEPGIWQVAAARKVGVVRVGDLQVTVTPEDPDRPAGLPDGLRPRPQLLA